MGAGIIYTAQAFAYNGVRGLGNAVGPATWAGIGMCTSFTWGVVLFKESVDSVPGCLGSLAVLMLGIFGVALSPTDIPQKIASLLTGDSSFVTDAADKKEQLQPLQTKLSLNGVTVTEPPPAISRRQGLLCALAVGLIDGSLMVPFKAFAASQPASSDHVSAIYLASLGAGLLVVAPTFSLCYVLVVGRGKFPPLRFKEGSLAGFSTGLFWGVANLGSVQATKYLGMSLGNWPCLAAWNAPAHAFVGDLLFGRFPSHTNVRVHQRRMGHRVLQGDGGPAKHWDVLPLHSHHHYWRDAPHAIFVVMTKIDNRSIITAK